LSTSTAAVRDEVLAVDRRQNDPKAFEYLETIVKGDILATAIFLPDPSRAAQKFRKTSVYLDTSVLVFALGYAGESRAAPAREMLELLYQAGADLRCFSHTADEIRSILTACAYRIERNQLVDSYGPSIEYFLERGFPASEIRIFIEKLEKDLAGLRVKIVDKPPFEADYMVDEQQLAEHIWLSASSSDGAIEYGFFSSKSTSGRPLT